MPGGGPAVLGPPADPAPANAKRDERAGEAFVVGRPPARERGCCDKVLCAGVVAAIPGGAPPEWLDDPP